MEPCPFHDGYEQFSSQQRLCAYAEMRAERDQWEQACKQASESYQQARDERDRYREALEKARNLLLSDGLLMANTPSTWNRFLGDMHAALFPQEEE